MKLKGVLASDLDGTIAVKGVIGAGEFRAAEKLRLAGIPLLVVTGRNSLSLQWVDGLRELADEILFSSGAGLQVASEALPRELHWLSAGEVQRIAGILNDFGEDYCILHRIPRSGNFSWVRRRPENADLDSRLKLYARWAKPLPPGGVARAFPEGAVHILVIRPSFPAPDSDLISALSEWSVFTGTSPLDHSSAWLEIFPAGVNKGGALSEWCARRGLSAGSVMALGNDYNDVPMLEWAAYPRVVGNAPDSLKKLPGAAVLPPAGEGGFASAVEEAVALFGTGRERARCQGKAAPFRESAAWL